MNGLVQNCQHTQEAVQQVLAQGIQGRQPLVGLQLPDEPEVSEEPHEPVFVQPQPPPIVSIESGVYTT